VHGRTGPSTIRCGRPGAGPRPCIGRSMSPPWVVTPRQERAWLPPSRHLRCSTR